MPSEASLSISLEASAEYRILFEKMCDTARQGLLTNRWLLLVVVEIQLATDRIFRIFSTQNSVKKSVRIQEIQLEFILDSETLGKFNTLIKFSAKFW